MYGGKRWSWRHNGGEEQVGMRSLQSHVGQGDVWAATMGHIWIHNCTTSGICEDDWPMLPLNLVWIPVVSAAAREHADVWELY